MEQPISAIKRYARGLVLKPVQIFDQALEEFQQAALDPQQAGKAYVQIALCMRSTGQYVEAVAAFRPALSSTTFSTPEPLHILYLIRQKLEALRRSAESLGVYRWIRNEDPDVTDIDARIKNIGVGERTSRAARQVAAHQCVQQLLDVWQQVRPRLVSRLEEAGGCLGLKAE